MASRRESDFQRLQEQLRKAEERVGQAEYHAEEERRSRQQAQQRAEEERQRAEEERQRAEEERQRAEEERQRAEAERRRNRPTTFEEFIRACHDSLSKPITIQSDKSLSTKGSVTNPKRKLCPTFLRPWEDFPRNQQRIFDHAYPFFHPSSRSSLRLFSPAIYLEELGQKLCRRKLASERDLESYERFAVEDHVTEIISHLHAIPEARQCFGLSDVITFENHANSLSDFAEEVQERLHIAHSYSPVRGSKTPPMAKPFHADQICVYKNNDGARSPLYIVEYKAPHKLSVENLRAGLRVMNIPDEVINRVTIPTDRDAKLNYNADQLVAAAMTQTFSYMIENGLEYSYLTNGVSLVFLRVKEDDPTTLYYHLTEPNEEAEPHDEYGFRYPRTAISQITCFTLMAFRSEKRNQAWRDDAIQRLQRYEIDYEAVLRKIPEDERIATPPSSIFKVPRHPIDLRSPYFLRKKKNRNSCNSAEGVVDDDPHHSSEESDEDPRDVDTPSKVRGRLKGKEVAATDRNESLIDNQAGNRSRKYCTQACLLGIIRQTVLDEKCPNVSSHRRLGKGNRHSIDMLSFQQLIRLQLGEDLDHNCEPLGKQGSRGALFKITLIEFGYTFVGKGTVEVFTSDLRHEGQIYQLLGRLQGRVIPVHLGNIDLLNVYYLDVGVRIQHMMLMSWCGERAEIVVGLDHQIRNEQVQQSTNEMYQAGVIHGDVRLPNILWSRELGRVMLIDFERATLVRRDQFDEARDQGSRILRDVSINRKRRLPEWRNGREVKSLRAESVTSMEIEPWVSQTRH